MLSEPFVVATCDYCPATEEVPLMDLGRQGYDDRNVRATLESWGWTLNDAGEDMCPDCSFECTVEGVE